MLVVAAAQQSPATRRHRGRCGRRHHHQPGRRWPRILGRFKSPPCPRGQVCLLFDSHLNHQELLPLVLPPLIASRAQLYITARGVTDFV